MLEHLNVDTFKEKVFNYEKNKEWKFEGDKPAVIDFMALWCAPCRQIAPILEELQEEHKGKINIYKVDVDNQQELAGMFGVKSIPSVLFIPKEGTPQMSTGALPKNAFNKAIKDVLNIE